MSSFSSFNAAASFATIALTLSITAWISAGVGFAGSANGLGAFSVNAAWYSIWFSVSAPLTPRIALSSDAWIRSLFSFPAMSSFNSFSAADSAATIVLTEAMTAFISDTVGLLISANGLGEAIKASLYSAMFSSTIPVTLRMSFNWSNVNATVLELPFKSSTNSAIAAWLATTESTIAWTSATESTSSGDKLAIMALISAMLDVVTPSTGKFE